MKRKREEENKKNTKLNSLDYLNVDEHIRSERENLENFEEVVSEEEVEEEEEEEEEEDVNSEDYNETEEEEEEEQEEEPSEDKKTLIEQICDYRIKTAKCLGKINKKLMEDEDVMVSLVCLQGFCYEQIPKKHQMSKRVNMMVLQSSGYDSTEMNKIPPQFFQDKEFTLYGLKHGMDFQNVPEIFQNDLEFCLEAVANPRNYFQCFKEEIRNNENFLLELIKLYPYKFEFVPSEIKKKLEWVLKAIEINPKVHEYLPEQYKRNKWVILKCIQLNNKCFEDEYLIPHLQDEKFALELMKWNKDFLRILPKEYLKKRKFIIEVLKRNNLSVSDMNSFSNEKEIAMIAIEFSVFSFENFSDKIKSDKEVLFHAARQSRNRIWNYNEYGSCEQFMALLLPYIIPKGIDFVCEILNINPDLFGNSDEFKELEVENPHYFREIAKKVPRLSYKLMSQRDSNDYEMFTHLIPEFKEDPKNEIGLQGRIKWKTLKPSHALKFLELSGNFLNYIPVKSRTTEMKTIAYKNGLCYDLAENNFDYLKDSIRSCPSNILTILHSLYHDENVTVECLKVLPKLMDIFGLKKYHGNLRCVLACFESINFTESKFDDCKTVDDFLVNGMNWMSPLEVRKNDGILSIIFRRRNFHFDLLKNEEYQDVIIHNSH
eukprot:gene2550-3512_t